DRQAGRWRRPGQAMSVTTANSHARSRGGDTEVPALDAPAVAILLVELGRRTALAGDNYFRAKAYLRAADSLSTLAEPLDRVVSHNRLRDVPGIGATIADIVTRLHRSGTHPLLEKLRRDMPEGLLDMLSIPGLKPEKVN